MAMCLLYLKQVLDRFAAVRFEQIVHAVFFVSFLLVLHKFVTKCNVLVKARLPKVMRSIQFWFQHIV